MCVCVCAQERVHGASSTHEMRYQHLVKLQQAWKIEQQEKAGRDSSGSATMRKSYEAGAPYGDKKYYVGRLKLCVPQAAVQASVSSDGDHGGDLSRHLSSSTVVNGQS